MKWFNKGPEETPAPIYRDDTGPPPPDPLDELRNELTARLEGLVGQEALQSTVELFNHGLGQLRQELERLRDELHQEREARRQADRELQRRLEEPITVPSQAEAGAPGPAAPALDAEQQRLLAVWSRQADRLLAQIGELLREAPEGIRQSLEATSNETQEIARNLKSSLKAATSGAAQVTVEVRVPSGESATGPAVMRRLRAQVAEALSAQCRPFEELDRSQTRLVTQLIPEICEVGEAARRQGDPNQPFFRTLDERLQALIETAGLEEIRPHPGTRFRPAEQSVLKAVRGDDPTQRDHIERCVSRGYKYQGQLLKKAEVTVFL